MVPFSIIIYSGSGTLRGRYIKATDSSVTFSGSIPKFLFGNNIQAVSLKEIQEGIIKLSEILGVPMHKATVTSLEFGANIEVNNAPALYTQKLGAMEDTTFKSNTWNDTKYWENSYVKVKIYDKKQEMKDKRQKAYIAGENMIKLSTVKHLLRYEGTFNNKKSMKIFGKSLIAENHWNKKVYFRLMTEWLGYYYLGINKLIDNPLDVIYEDIKKPKDFDKWSLAMVNGDRNISTVLKKLFKEREKSKDKDYEKQNQKQHSTNQNKIKSAMKWKPKRFKSSELIEELTDKIFSFAVNTLDAEGVVYEGVVLDLTKPTIFEDVIDTPIKKKIPPRLKQITA